MSSSNSLDRERFLLDVGDDVFVVGGGGVLSVNDMIRKMIFL